MGRVLWFSVVFHLSSLLSLKVDNTDFHVEKNITAASASSGGTEVGVEVTYEPSRLGDTRATLTVFSPVGGEYVFPPKLKSADNVHDREERLSRSHVKNLTHM